MQLTVTSCKQSTVFPHLPSVFEDCWPVLSLCPSPPLSSFLFFFSSSATFSFFYILPSSPPTLSFSIEYYLLFSFLFLRSPCLSYSLLHLSPISVHFSLTSFKYSKLETKLTKQGLAKGLNSSEVRLRWGWTHLQEAKMQRGTTVPLLLVSPLSSFNCFTFFAFSAHLIYCRGWILYQTLHVAQLLYSILRMFGFAPGFQLPWKNISTEHLIIRKIATELQKEHSDERIGHAI